MHRWTCEQVLRFMGWAFCVEMCCLWLLCCVIKGTSTEGEGLWSTLASSEPEMRRPSRDTRRHGHSSEGVGRTMPIKWEALLHVDSVITKNGQTDCSKPHHTPFQTRSLLGRGMGGGEGWKYHKYHRKRNARLKGRAWLGTLAAAGDPGETKLGGQQCPSGVYLRAPIGNTFRREELGCWSY